MTPRLLLASLTLCGVAVFPAYAQGQAPMAAALPEMPMNSPAGLQPAAEVAPTTAAIQPPPPPARLHFRPLGVEPPARPERPPMPAMSVPPEVPAVSERPEISAPPAESTAAPASADEAQDRAERQQYLDAVREQRRALMEERSKAWRETAAGRPPMMAPWGDAMHEQRQQEMDQRREAMEQYNRQRQEEMRAHRYWTNPHSAYISDMSDRRREAMDDLAKQRREQMGKLRDGERRMMGPGPWGATDPWGYPGW